MDHWNKCLCFTDSFCVFVFNQGKSNEQVVTEYFELLKKKDYKQMYQMLNPKIVYTPTQKYFVEKYKEFYEEIDAKIFK